jgi:hypothetical protein
VVEKARMIPWLWAIYVSVLLWLAVAVGNIALFTLRPAEHWPVLETIEGLQTASLIPIALLLHRINRRSRQSAVVTVAGTLAMLLGAVLSFAFASDLLTFGTGMIAVFGDTVALVGLLVWLFTTNVLAWRGPGSAAQFGHAWHGRRHYNHPSLSRLGAVAGSNPAASGCGTVTAAVGGWPAAVSGGLRHLRRGRSRVSCQPLTMNGSRGCPVRIRRHTSS